MDLREDKYFWEFIHLASVRQIQTTPKYCRNFSEEKQLHTENTEPSLTSAISTMFGYMKSPNSRKLEYRSLAKSYLCLPENPVCWGFGITLANGVINGN